MKRQVCPAESACSTAAAFPCMQLARLMSAVPLAHCGPAAWHRTVPVNALHQGSRATCLTPDERAFPSDTLHLAIKTSFHGATAIELSAYYQRLLCMMAYRTYLLSFHVRTPDLQNLPDASTNALPSLLPTHQRTSHWYIQQHLVQSWCRCLNNNNNNINKFTITTIT